MKMFNLKWILIASTVLFDPKVSAMGGQADASRLFKDLLVDYNPAIRPALDYSQPTEASTRLELAIVLDLDIKNQVLKFSGFMSFTWRDELLMWDPDKYGGVKEIILPQKSVWKPDIAIYNGIDKVFLGDEELQVFVNYNGQVRWEPVTSLSVACSVDVTRYPFDKTLCYVNVTTWMNDESTINLTPSPNPVSLKYLVPSKEFIIWSDGVEVTRADFYGKIYKWLSFKIRLDRRPTYLAITLLMPIMLLAVLSVFSFFLSPEETEKVSLAITILLSFTVFLSVIDNDLPQTSDRMSVIVVYIVFLLVFSFLAVVGNALVIIVHRRDIKKTVEGRAVGVEDNKQGELTASLTERYAQIDSDYNNVEFLPPVPRWSFFNKVVGEGPTAFKLNRLFLLLNTFFLILVSIVTAVLMFS